MRRTCCWNRQQLPAERAIAVLPQRRPLTPPALRKRNRVARLKQLSFGWNANRRVCAVVVRLVNALAINDAVTRAISRIRERVGLVVAVVVAPVITARIIINTIIYRHVRRFRATRDKQGDDARAKQRQQRPSPTAFAFAFSYSFHQII